MDVYLITLFVHFLLLVILGIFLSARVTDSPGYYVTSRRLSPGLLGASLPTAYIGARSTVGSTGLGYPYGFSVWWGSDQPEAGLPCLNAGTAPSLCNSKCLQITRGISFLAGTLGVFLAIAMHDVISALKIFYGLLTVSLLVPLVAGLYWSKVSSQAAMASILMGISMTLLIQLTTNGTGSGAWVWFILLVDTGKQCFK